VFPSTTYALESEITNGLLFWYQKGSEIAVGSLCFYGMVSIKNNIAIMNQMDGSDLNITEEQAMHV
jgi:hypothetical protein